MTAKEYLEQVGNKEIYIRNLQKKIERLRKVLDSAGAVHTSDNRWSYFINARRFYEIEMIPCDKISG